MSRRRTSIDRSSLLALAAAAGAFGSVSAQDVLAPRPLAAAGEQHLKPTAEPPTPPALQLRGRQQPQQQPGDAGISLADMPTENVHTNGGVLRQRDLLVETDEDGDAAMSKVAAQDSDGDMDMAAILDPFYGIDLDALGDLAVPIDDDHLPPATGERRLNLLREMTEQGKIDDSEDDEEEEDSSQVTNRIVNGQRTHLSSFVMTLDDRGGKSYRGVCGATMISKRWAVTAAHVSPTEAPGFFASICVIAFVTNRYAHQSSLTSLSLPHSTTIYTVHLQLQKERPPGKI